MNEEYRDVVIIKDIDAYLMIIDLALKNGKKTGDDMTEEFKEIMKRHPDKFEVIGQTKLDKDMLTGELRERGLRVLNVEEVQRQKEINKKDQDK